MTTPPGQFDALVAAAHTVHRRGDRYWLLAGDALVRRQAERLERWLAQGRLKGVLAATARDLPGLRLLTPDFATPLAEARKLALTPDANPDLLRRVLRDDGLIVAGWTASGAVADAIEHTPSPRHRTFWARPAEGDERGRALIDLRGAHVLDDGPDAVLDALDARLAALDADGPSPDHPPDVAVVHLKRLIAGPGAANHLRAYLFDLVAAATADPTGPAARALPALCAWGGYGSDGPLAPIWPDALAELAGRAAPADLLDQAVWACGAGALSAGNRDLLAALIPALRQPPLAERVVARLSADPDAVRAFHLALRRRIPDLRGGRTAFGYLVDAFDVLLAADRVDRAADDPAAALLADRLADHHPNALDLTVDDIQRRGDAWPGTAVFATPDRRDRALARLEARAAA